MHATWAPKIFLLHLHGEVSEASFAAERAHLAGKAERATNEPHLGPSKLSYVQTGQLGRRPPRARPIHASARRGSHANICVRSLTRVTARWDRLLWGFGSFVALLSFLPPTRRACDAHAAPAVSRVATEDVCSGPAWQRRGGPYDPIHPLHPRRAHRPRE